MASEYLKWKYRDVKREEEKPLTPAEKRRNWWHYNRWPLLIGIIVFLIFADLLAHALHLFEVQPDLQIAYTGASSLPDDTVRAVEEAFSAYIGDANGDGRILVTLHQYPSEAGAGSEGAANGAASGVRLMADLEDCESFLFILEDPETFQKTYEVLSKTNGTLPEEGQESYTDCYYLWGSCPVLSSLSLGTYEETVAGQQFSGSSDALMQSLYIARRGFWTEKTVRNEAACIQCWEQITEGAGK